MCNHELIPLSDATSTAIWPNMQIDSSSLTHDISYDYTSLRTEPSRSAYVLCWLSIQTSSTNRLVTNRTHTAAGA